MIDLQGWLYWQASEKTSILGKPQWKRRWIILTPDAIFIYKTDREGTNPPNASYALASFQTATILEPTKKAPSALSLKPDPNRSANPRYNNPVSSATASLLRKSRRQSTPSTPTLDSLITHTPLSNSPVLFRAEPDSPISLHEWQRSINDRILSPFPSEPAPPSPPPPVPKVPYGTVNMYTTISSPARGYTLPSSAGHKSLSQSMTSNISAALSSVTSPTSRRKSRTISPSEMKRTRDADAQSMSSSESRTPPPTSVPAFFESEEHSLPNAEKVLEQAMRFHAQRRRVGNLGRTVGSGTSHGKEGSVSSALSRENVPSPMIRPVATMPAMKTTTAPDLSIASFEVLIKELEAEEEERNKKRATPIPTSTPPLPPLPPSPANSSHSIVDTTPVPPPPKTLPTIAIPRPRRPSAIHEAKRRSTGSILFNQLTTPTFQSFDKENSFPSFLHDRKGSITSITGSRRLSVASFGSQLSESKRNSVAREEIITFNFVDWSSADGSAAGVVSAPAPERTSRGDVYGMLGRSDSIVSSVLSEFDYSRRSSYNYGRRGSVF